MAEPADDAMPIPNVGETVGSYLAEHVHLSAQVPKTQAELRELFRLHMERVLEADREQLFGQPALE